ncbi:hypothetical protein TOPH_03283 [Tolypocladium ophioglossoides CBS 100239]|uniref:SMP-30/Gluconolactonase/LRE-like region domain-containing protein n=1 Tax=Tolypocladium ophioglossoides (strain CBS 100239) TaxID=1163406 RepID=A0A0L0NE08_TOLOC|nr:hypothetical protein TOPH_03283 [Tolypocladium ophioglossoides CBS 100239]
MRLQTLLTWSSTLLAAATASPVVAPGLDLCPNIRRGVASRTVYEFPNGSWIENIAVRANGNLLVTRLDTPELYEIDPRNSATAKLIHHFTGYTSLLGISESSPDVFSVAVGNLSLTTGGRPQSFAIWTADFKGKTEPKVSKVTDIPEALLLNGVTALDRKAGTILVSDSALGVVFRVDTRSGTYTTALEDDTFKPPANASSPLGINGIRVVDGHMYYVNTLRPLYGRVPVDRASGKATGPYQVISTKIAADDFAVDRKGTAHMAVGVANEIAKVRPNGKSCVVAGSPGSKLIAGATSVAFGRTREEKHILYVSTSGAQAWPVNGTYTEGGKIVALEIH